MLQGYIRWSIQLPFTKDKGNLLIDLHTHTFLSDGALAPAELARRCEDKGYRCLVFSDHVDNATIDLIVPRLAKAARELSEHMDMQVLGGAELTHCRPEQIPDLIALARELGAQVVLVHGETIVEPVLAGTNRAAIDGGADIIAHPGLIGPEEIRLAAERGIRLEISGRKGHSFTNGHVFRLARECGATLVFGTDSHEPGDLMTREMAERVARGAGMEDSHVQEMFQNAEALVREVCRQQQGEGDAHEF